MSLSLLTNIVRTCTHSKALESLRKTPNTVPSKQTGDLRSLLDLMDSLTLQSFGEVSGDRKSYSILPDSLVELEKPLFNGQSFLTCPTVFPRSDSTLPAGCTITHSDQKVISYMTTLYTDPENQFVVQMFFLPKDAKMPLHDHPSMSVLSKVVTGSIDVCSYSLDSNTSPQGSPRRSQNIQRRRVTPHARYTLTPSDSTSILTADLGNLHAMRALEPTLFFDILTPPYDPPSRDCIYYSLRKTSLESQELLGTEISATSINSLWENDDQFDSSKTLFQATPYEPVWFTCSEVPWKGPEISL